MDEISLTCDVRCLNPQPDEVVVISISGARSAALTEQISKTAKKAFPDNRIVILDHGLNLEAIGAIGYVVWKGHRDYEEDVAVCLTKPVAEKVLAGNGVAMRHVPGSEHTDSGSRGGLMDEEATPWGIQEVPLVGSENATNAR